MTVITRMWAKTNRRLRFFAWISASVALVVALLSSQVAIAHGPSKPRLENIVFVNITDDAPTGKIAENPARFSQILGSGRLLVNEENQVTGYYFTASGLEPNQTMPYHFHTIRLGSTLTSCEGDKGILETEAEGEVIPLLSEKALGDIAPLKASASGVATVGTASNPVKLPDPVPLEEIGYLVIHSAQGAPIGPSMVCANVRLDPAGFSRPEGNA